MNRKGTAKYTPMSSPHPDRMRTLDVTLLRNKKEVRLVQEIATAARQHFKEIKRPTGSVGGSQALGMLEYRLVNLMNPGEEQKPPSAPGIVAGARLGYVIGVMENGSGIAHDGQCEAHYTNAMVVISTEFSRVLPPTAMSEFATECGYYLARTHDQTLDGLMEIANQHAVKLGGMPFVQKSELHFIDDGYPWGVGWWENALMSGEDGAITTGRDGLAFFSGYDAPEVQRQWDYSWDHVNSAVVTKVDDLPALTAHPDLSRDVLDYAIIVGCDDPLSGVSESHLLVILMSKSHPLDAWKTLFADHQIKLIDTTESAPGTPENDPAMPEDPQPAKWAVPSAGLREPEPTAAPGWWRSPDGIWNPPEGGSPNT